LSETFIRHAEPADLDFIVDANLAMAHETEGIVLDRDRAAAGVRAALADPQKACYRIATRAGRAVGQLMLTHEWSDWRNGDFWWIQSVYVVPGQRRTGVFRALYEHTVAEARRRPDVCGVRLYVAAENGAAQTTYGALGMRRAGYHVYEVDFVLGAGPVAHD
jgi:ribosomal protein S18 acetylase RimI-like enzyme